MLDRMLKTEWCVAIRARDKHLLIDEGGESAKFAVIPNTTRYWCADPFLYNHEGREYLFMECYDRIKRKGVIGYREIYSNGKYSKLKIVYESAGHLSYPFIYSNNGNIYMIPESSKDKKVSILRATSFPNHWEEEVVLLEGRYVDTTRHVCGGSTYLFTTPIVEDNSSILELYTYDNGIVSRCPASPIVVGNSIARQGGNIIVIGDKSYRISQDCESEYGKAINISIINQLTADKYEEQLVQKVTIDMIKLNKTKVYHGIHSYNIDDMYEVIDLKLNRQFKLMNLLGFLASKLIRG